MRARTCVWGVMVIVCFGGWMSMAAAKPEGRAAGGGGAGGLKLSQVAFGMDLYNAAASSHSHSHSHAASSRPRAAGPAGGGAAAGHVHKHTDLVKAATGEDPTTTLVEAARTHNQHVMSTRKVDAGAALEGGCTPADSKVINLGLPRTGTRAIVEVLAQIGYKGCHQLQYWNMQNVKDYVNDPFTPAAANIADSLAACDVMADTPVYGLWKGLKRAPMPNARFVLTTRGQGSWMTEMQELIEFWGHRLPDEFVDFHKFYFKTKTGRWEAEEFKNTFWRHHQDVMQLLGDKVLVLPHEMPASEKLQTLTEFLGCPEKAAQMTWPTKPPEQPSSTAAV